MGVLAKGIGIFVVIVIIAIAVGWKGEPQNEQLSDNIIQVLPKGKKVELIRSGWYQNEGDNAEWYLVSYDNHEGWIYAALSHLD